MQSITRGKSTDFYTRFIDRAGVVVTPTAPPTYTMYDPTGVPVSQGIGQQFLSDATMFAATVVIPVSAPLTVLGSPYTVIWGLASGGVEYTNKESFYVVDAAPPIANPVGLSSQAINISAIATKTLVKPPTYTIYDGNTIVTTGAVTISSGLVTPNGVQYNATIAANTLPPIQSPYTVIWDLGMNVVSSLGVVDAVTFTHINTLRDYMDKAKLQDGLTTLDYTEYNLLSYLYTGMDYINGSLPEITTWTLQTLPKSMQFAHLLSSAYCGLSSQYIAEGMSAFDFSGQQVTLSVNRTDTIDSAIQRAMEWLGENLIPQKRLTLRQGVNGHLGIQLGIHTNRVSRSVGISRTGNPIGTRWW